MTDLGYRVIPDLYAGIEPNVGAANIKLGLSFDYFIRKIDYINVEKDDVNIRNSSFDIHYEYYDKNISENLIIKTKDIWCIYNEEPWEWDGEIVDDTYAYWNNSVVLRFSKRQDGSFILLSIYLQNKYKGKYINALGLGDRVSLVLDKYDILFYADLHYLAKKININELENFDGNLDQYEVGIVNNLSWEDREIIKGISIQTNYREAVDITNFKDQIIESIEVFIDS